MGCSYHCWIDPRDHDGHTICCSCGGTEDEKDQMVTWTVEITRSRAEIRRLAVSGCALCGGSGIVGEHRTTVCSCVDPTDIFGMKDLFGGDRTK